MGTSIVAVSYRGGVILGADSRTSNGNYIANRVTDKITPLADSVYMLRSGSAADTQAIAGYVQLYISQHQAEANARIRVKAAANMAMAMAYGNKDMLQVCGGQRRRARACAFAREASGPHMRRARRVCAHACTALFTQPAGWAHRGGVGQRRRRQRVGHPAGRHPHERALRHRRLRLGLRVRPV